MLILNKLKKPLCYAIYNSYIGNIYLKRGHGPPQSLNIWGVDFGSNTACLPHIVTRCRAYRTSQSHLLAKKFVITKMRSDITKCINVGDINIDQGDQAAIRGVTGQAKINDL